MVLVPNEEHDEIIPGRQESLSRLPVACDRCGKGFKQQVPQVSPLLRNICPYFFGLIFYSAI